MIPLLAPFCLESMVIEPQQVVDPILTCSADVQKFCVALRKVHACGPTGVVEGNIFSMAVAVH